jgi:seryl-tRNA synthetase
MLDIKYIRDHADELRQAVSHKNLDPQLVDQVLELDTKRRNQITIVETLRKQANDHSAQFKTTRPTPEDIATGRDIKTQLQAQEPVLSEIEQAYLDAMYLLPNPALADVPIGKDESQNVVVKTVGQPTKFTFTPRDHMELGEALDIIDTQTAARVSGSRFGYLKGDGAMLEFALIQFVITTLTNPDTIKMIADSVQPGYNSKPFVPVVPPVIIRPEVFRRMGRLSEADKDERYHLDQDDLYLIGSAEHTLGPIHMDQILPEKDLPVRYIGFSTAFRREAGSYGKDVSGIFRVHQFDKLEIETFTTPEDSQIEQDFIVAVQEHLISSLGLPYQLVAICTGDMGKPDARQYDIDCWIPSQGKYRETNTSDLMTDYQSRRLDIRVQKTSGQLEYVHMNDATAIAIGRTIIAILENNQQADGTVVVPPVLVPYVGKTVIKRAS